MVKFLKSAAFWGAALIGGRWYLEGGVYFDLSVNDAVLIRRWHCVKSVQIRSFFWSIFSCIRTEYMKIRTRKNSVFGYFSRTGCLSEGIRYFYLPIYILMVMKSLVSHRRTNFSYTNCFCNLRYYYVQCMFIITKVIFDCWTLRILG